MKSMPPSAARSRIDTEVGSSTAVRRSSSQDTVSKPVALFVQVVSDPYLDKVVAWLSTLSQRYPQLRERRQV